MKNIRIIFISLLFLFLSTLSVSALTDRELDVVRSYNYLTEDQIQTLNDNGKLTQADIENIKAGIRKLTYEDFYARGDGVSNDYLFIKATHDFANKLYIEDNILVTVYGNPNATYYVSNGIKNDGNGSVVKEKQIDITTNVDWQNAKFIFDDYVDENNDGINDIYYTSPVFEITSKMLAYSRLCNDNNENAYISGTTKINTKMDPNTTNAIELVNRVKQSAAYKNTVCNGKYYIKEAFDNSRYWQVVITNNNKQFIRSGGNANEGDWQHETFIIDSQNGDLMQKLQWTYDDIRLIHIFPISNKTIKIQNATFTTKTNNMVYNFEYKRLSYSNRNLRVFYTGNIEINNINHALDEEAHAEVSHYPYVDNKDYNELFKNSNQYDGFINLQYSSYIKLNNIKLSSHTAPPYIKYQNNSYVRIGTHGTYDLKINNSSNIFINNLSYYCTEGKSDSECYNDNMNNSKKWGISGTNYIKNLFIKNSTLNRVDSHCGVYNLMIEDSTIGDKGFALIGKGIFYSNNVTINGANYLVTLRNDYGSTFDGNIIMDNTTLNTGTEESISLIQSNNNGSHYYGYNSYFPNVYINNATINTNSNNNSVALIKLADISNSSTENAKYYIKDNISFKNIILNTDNVYIFPESFLNNENNLIASNYGENNIVNISFDLKNTNNETIVTKDNEEYLSKILSSSEENGLDYNYKFKILNNQIDYSTLNDINNLKDEYNKSYNLFDEYNVNEESNKPDENTPLIVEVANTGKKIITCVICITLILIGIYILKSAKRKA